MKNKKDLAKIALTALILASATPVTGHADSGFEVQGLLLAAGCPAHGCPSASAPANNNPSPAAGQNSRDYGRQPDGRNPAGAPPGGNAGSSNGYDNGAGGPPPGYRGSATGGNNNPADNYNSRGNPSYSGYNGQPGRQASAYPDTNYDNNAGAGTTSTATLTEPQLLGMLTPQGRAIYQSLDPEAKALAIQLASQDSYRDKNLAIKEAQRRMNERRSNR